jgi:hypothetical protein
MSSSSALHLNALPASQGSVGAAFGEVATAFKHLASALVRTTFTTAEAPTQTLTAYEEAEALRSYAADIQAQDPDFAQDLFAAANRHEIAAADGVMVH